MKKIYFMLTLALIMLVGCSTQQTVDTEAAELLNSDVTVADFVLNDVVYTLPAPLSEFLDNGWEIDRVDPTVESISSKQLGLFALTHNDYDSDINITVYNDSDSDKLLSETNVVLFEFENIDDGEKVQPYLVVKGGITNLSSEKEFTEILLDINEQFNPDGYNLDTDIMVGTFESRLSIDPNSDGIRRITLNTGDFDRSTLYVNYQTAEERETSIAELKEDKEVGDSYSEIMSSIDSSHNIHETLEVTEIVYGGRIGTTLNNKYFFAEDSKGNVYALYDASDDLGYINQMSSIEIGDKIEVWGKSTEGLQLQDGKGSVPILKALYIEKDGNVIYHDKSLTY